MMQLKASPKSPNKLLPLLERVWLVAIRLLQNNIKILSFTHDVGGTWRENQYPGAACDVQSLYYFHLQLKLTGQALCEAPEIFAYIQELDEQVMI